MSKFQLRDADDQVIGEEFVGSFEEANAWSTAQDIEPGWTLFEQSGGHWIPARIDPSDA